MRRLIAAAGSIWAVLAIALVLAFGQQHAGAPPATSTTTLTVVRQANGTYRAVPVAVHATTQTSGAAASSQAAPSLTGQLISSSPTVSSHATTRSS